jgi:phenylalanine ammonia-lyase
MEELTTHISKHLPSGTAPALLHARLLPVILTSLDATTTMDADARLPVVISATTSPILDFLSSSGTPKLPGDIIKSVAAFRASFAKRGAAILQDLRHSFVSGKPPSSSAPGYDPRAPAGPILGRTRLVYEYIRIQLGVRMHGLEHWNQFEDGLGSLPSIGENISLIYEVSVAL